MTKHRRWSDKPKNDSIEKKEKIELVEEEIPHKKTSMNSKSVLLSGTKYVYILVTAALLAGIFTPLTLGVENEEVIQGIVVIFLGLGGGVLIILGIKNQKYTTITVCGGFVMIFVTLILIYELSGRSIF